MKRYCGILVAIVFVLLYREAGAQSGIPGNYKIKRIDPLRLDISTGMTTNLIFPYAIKSVDRGSIDILAQKAKGSENVLQVKAAKAPFKQSNLSVVTADGQLFSFLIDYAEYPSHLNLSFYKDSLAEPVLLADGAIPQDELQQTAAIISERKPFMRRRVQQQMIKLALGSIHYHQDMLWFAFDITNRSLIDYDIQYVKFFVKDKKRAKRTAEQSKELQPVFVSPVDNVSGDHPEKVIIALPAFTLSQKQEVRVMLKEKNGGRDLELRLKYPAILKARLL